jgi:hypothetical protein
MDVCCADVCCTGVAVDPLVALEVAWLDGPCEKRAAAAVAVAWLAGRERARARWIWGWRVRRCCLRTVLGFAAVFDTEAPMAGALVARTCASVLSAGSGTDDAATRGLVATVRVERSRMIAKAATTAKMRTPAMSEGRPSRRPAASRSGRLLWFAELVVRRVRRRAGLIGGVSIAALPGAASERVGAGVEASASSSNGSRSSSAVSSSALAGDALS